MKNEGDEAGTPLRKTRLEPAAGAYAQRVEAEQLFYRHVTNVHELPAIFQYWSDRHIRPMIEEFGFSDPEELYSEYWVRGARANGDAPPVFLSIGAGNCDTEIRVAQRLRKAGISRFVIECLDLNGAMLQRGRDLASEAGLDAHLAFVEGDFNHWEGSRQYTGVMAHQSLHHVVALERLFDEIKRCLLPHGYFLTNDMIGRNGHLRWPEAMRGVQSFWKELPVEYRWNPVLERYEEEYQDYDCSTEGFEGIRSQDILPLLTIRFDFSLFVAFGNVINPFVARTFGMNFDVDREWDRTFIDRVHAFDEEALGKGVLTPTQMLAAMTPGPSAEHRFSRGLTPERCIRREFASVEEPKQFKILTTSLRPTTPAGWNFSQQLLASGGLPPYCWSATELPPGLSLDHSGRLSGALASPGLFTPTITVEENSPARRISSQRYTLIADTVPEPLVVISSARLPGGVIRAAYSWSLHAAGGKPPYQWSLVKGTLPRGLSIDDGLGVLQGQPQEARTSVFTLQVSDSASAEQTLEMTVTIARDGPRPYRLVLPQIACGGGWKTSVRLINASPSQVTVSVRFRSSEGHTLMLPLRVGTSDAAGKWEAAVLDETVFPYSSLEIETDAETGADRAGWVEVCSDVPVMAEGTVSHAAFGAATVEFDSWSPVSFLLPYDHSDGSKTAAALVNLDPRRANDVSVAIWSDDWKLIATEQWKLPANGHTALLIPDRFRMTQGGRGMVQFASELNAGLAGLALRFLSDGRVVPGLKLRAAKKAVRAGFFD